MIRKTRLIVAVILALWARGAPVEDPLLRRYTQELTAVLRWEILWGELPEGFKIPSNGLAHVALYLRPDSLSYCSHDLGVCVRYQVFPHRNWIAATTAACDESGSDNEALLAFAGEKVRKQAASGGSQQKLTLGGPEGATGSPTPGSGVLWDATPNLGSREETVRQYKRLHPKDIGGLEKWLRDSTTSHAGVKQITIACFAPTDPEVFYYVDRAIGASAIMSVFWPRPGNLWVTKDLSAGLD